MTITSPNVVTFANQVVRRAADRMGSGMAFIDSILADIDAPGSTIVASLGSDPTAYIDDGSLSGGQYPGSPDGRAPITVGQVLGFIAVCRRLKAQADATTDPITGQPLALTSRQLFASIAVNPDL